jgi:hypothetical protein
MAIESKISKIYDLKAIGVSAILSDLNKIDSAFAKVVKTKSGLTGGAGLAAELKEAKAVTEAVQKMRVARAEDAQAAVVEAKAQQAHTTAIKEATSAISKQDEELLEAQMAAREWAKANKTAEVEVKKTTKAVRDLAKEEAEEKKILRDRTAALKNQVREELNAKGSLENRRAALIRLNTVYDRLSPKERDTSWGRRMADTIKNVSLQVKALESATDRNQRNVGNYAEGGAKGFDKLSKSAGKAWGIIRQAAYIIPGLGIAGIMGLGVEGVLALANAMDILSTTTEEQKKQVEFYTALQDKMIKSIAEEQAALSSLYTTATNANISYRERGKAVDELIKMYPEYFTNANREKLLNGELTDSYDALTLSIAKRAEATAMQNELTKLFEEKVSAQIKLNKLLNFDKDGEFYYSRETADRLMGIISLKDDEIKQIQQMMQYKKEDFSKDAFYLNEGVKAKVLAQQKLDKLHAFKGDTTKSDKTAKADAEKAAREAERAAKVELKAAEERAQAIWEARKTLMDNQTREEAELAVRYGKMINDAKGASEDEMNVIVEAYELERLNIRKKYLTQVKDMTDDVKQMELENQKIINNQKEKAESDFQKRMLDKFATFQKRNKENYDKAVQQEREKEQLLSELREAGYRDANKYIDAYINKLYVQNEVQFDTLQQQLDSQKQERLAQAQSQAERDAIEKEHDQQQKEIEKQRNNERLEIAKKQLAIEFAVASLKAISTSKSIYEGLVKEAIVAGNYLSSLALLNSQKFQDGGEVPTSTGGDIKGPSHAQGGVKFNYEAEGSELAIINKKSSQDKGRYSVAGTPRQIASAINTIGGGISFAPGAALKSFAYGGMLGASVQPPIFSSYFSNSTNELAEMKAIVQGLAISIRSESYKPVLLNPNAITKHQTNHNKNISLASV